MLGLYVARTPAYAPLALWRRELPQWPTLRRLLGLGGPIGLSLLMQAGLFTALALLMGTLGKIHAAAHQITLNYAGLVYMLPLGLAFATASLVGQHVGRGLPARARRIGYTGIALCSSLAMSIGLLTWFLAPHIARPILPRYTRRKRQCVCTLQISELPGCIASCLELLTISQPCFDSAEYGAFAHVQPHDVDQFAAQVFPRRCSVHAPNEFDTLFVLGLT